MSLKKFDLTGKVALITGAAGLLGREHAAALLECGAFVVLTDTNTSSLEESIDILSAQYCRSKIFSAYLDVTDPLSIRSLHESLVEMALRVDILINNAAIDPKVNPDHTVVEASRLEHFPLSQWNLQLAVGLTGAFLCSQVFGTAMARDMHGGVILNIASDLSVISPDQRLYRIESLSPESQPVKPVSYSVVKAGLIGLTRYLSTYWPDKGVRCNALSPGGVFNGQSEDFVDRLTSLIPLGRMADRSEYRSAIQFLCSDASSYMNGQNVIIDGGRSVL